MMDVRSQQCREFDNNNFDIASLHENVKWVPKYGGKRAIISELCSPWLPWAHVRRNIPDS